MRKYTRKELKNMVALGMAEDVTRANNEDYERIIKKEGFLSQIGYSSGVYGCDGMLLKGYKTGGYYAVTSRTSAIYIFCWMYGRTKKQAKFAYKIYSDKTIKDVVDTYKRNCKKAFYED